MRLTHLFSASLFVLALAHTAAADDLQKGTGTGIDQATKGTTDITSDKFQARDKDGEKDTKDTTELSVSAGALNTGGNSQLVALTGASKFRLRRGANQFKAAAAFNFARTALPGAELATTANNIQGLARYDRFLGDVSLFLSAQARNDRFQGLDLRQQVDPGVAYYFINEKTSQLWVELGYDLLFDVRRNDARVPLDADKKPAVDAAGQPLPLLAKTRTIHSARGFIGFEYVLNEGSKLVAGVEALQGLAGSESNTKNLFRLNGDIALSAKVSKSISLALSFSERYDSTPLPGKQSLDTVLAASLVYSFL